MILAFFGLALVRENLGNAKAGVTDIRITNQIPPLTVSLTATDFVTTTNFVTKTNFVTATNFVTRTNITNAIDQTARPKLGKP